MVAKQSLADWNSEEKWEKKSHQKIREQARSRASTSCLLWKLGRSVQDWLIQPSRAGVPKLDLWFGQCGKVVGVGTVLLVQQRRKIDIWTSHSFLPIEYGADGDHQISSWPINLPGDPLHPRTRWLGYRGLKEALLDSQTQGQSPVPLYRCQFSFIGLFLLEKWFGQDLAHRFFRSKFYLGKWRRLTWSRSSGANPSVKRSMASSMIQRVYWGPCPEVQVCFRPLEIWKFSWSIIYRILLQKSFPELCFRRRKRARSLA